MKTNAKTSIPIKKVSCNVKRDTVDKVINKLISDGLPTRSSVANELGISTMTVGKISLAMRNTGYVDENFYTKAGSKNPGYYVSISQETNMMVLDLSSPVFTINVISGDSKLIFSESYNYNVEIGLEDNLLIFLSRCAIKATKEIKGVRVMSVLYSESPEKCKLPNQFSYSHLPSISDCDKVNRTVASVYRKEPTLHLTVSDAVLAAIDYNLIGVDCSVDNISYAYIGHYLYAFNISNGNVHICNINNLFLDNDKTLSEKYLISNTKTNFNYCATAVTNFMSCAYNSPMIIIESDKHLFDKESLRFLTRSFAFADLVPPIIASRTEHPSISVMGAARRGLAQAIKQHIITK